MYTVTVDRAHCLIQATLSGLLSTEEVVAYIAEVKRQFILNRLHGYVMIIDVTGCPIQPQHVLITMGEHMATMPKARSLAVVTGSSLARMQVRRMFTQPYCRITTTLEDARGWVLMGTEPTEDGKGAATAIKG